LKAVKSVEYLTQILKKPELTLREFLRYVPIPGWKVLQSGRWGGGFLFTFGSDEEGLNPQDVNIR
jgi:hypothetical protein